MRRIREIAQLSERAVTRLRRILDIQFAQKQQGDVVPDILVPASLDRYLPGNCYGFHKEVILRREVRREFVPPWFDPISTPGHFGIIEGDFRVYLEVDVDVVKRNAPSTFETRIASLVEDEPAQMALL